MHARSHPGRPHDLRAWILFAVVLAVLGLMALAWDPGDLGDGLVLGSGGAVSAVADTAQGGTPDLLAGAPPVLPGQSGR